MCSLYFLHTQAPLYFFIKHTIHIIKFICIKTQGVIFILEKISNIVWGNYTLVFILASGLFLTVKSRFFQLLKSKTIFRTTICTLFKKSHNKCDDNEISQFGSFCSVLAATMGTGNIIGVACAITTGGAGAIFWMWISAFTGMMIVYSENYFGTMFREKDSNGKWHGGAMNYIKAAFKTKYIALLYAIFCVFASLGMGNMVQSNSISCAVSEINNNILYITGAVTAFLCGMVIIGGIKRIANITQITIPLISISYIIASLAVIFKNHEYISEAFGMIFGEAFGIKAVGGGISGAVISRGISTGLKRGVFSNEAGLGTSAMIHTSGVCRKPQIQGMWGILEVFADTFVCCTITALAVLCYILKSGDHSCTGAELIINTFGCCFGKYAIFIVTVSIIFFAFATLIGWAHCGESAFLYITGNRFTYLYRFVYCITAFLGAVTKPEIVWTVSDIFNGLMIFPNVSAIMILTAKKGISTDIKAEDL